MESKYSAIYKKIKWASPWMSSYPVWRAGELLRRLSTPAGPRHIMIMMANHFEPGWDARKVFLDWSIQLERVKRWNEDARLTGKLIQDSDGMPFGHTNFYPAEQYHESLLDSLAELQADGIGEVEIHLHHGLQKPDTAENLRRSLEDFRDILAEKHGCLSRVDGDDQPKYAFVHGNFALANSIGGVCCGVDEELEILAETGCYADYTLPASPSRPQVPMINAIYQCGNPLNERSAHRSGPRLEVGRNPELPVIFTGPLIFDWKRKQIGLPFPGIDNGDITNRYSASIDRLESWTRANISISGRPDWIFIKLFCHGFLPGDQPATIGEPMRRFLGEAMEWAGRNGNTSIHFTSAREMFNIAMAAVDGYHGDPGRYRDYRLRPIMQSRSQVKNQFYQAADEQVGKYASR